MKIVKLGAPSESLLTGETGTAMHLVVRPAEDGGFTKAYLFQPSRRNKKTGKPVKCEWLTHLT
jgi:hypothetical protein